MLRKLSIVALLTWSSIANAEIVDTRSAEYREGTLHLAQANQALKRAISELKQAEAAYEFPGLDIVAKLGRLQEVEQRLDKILAPERNRLKHKTIVPDGTFFSPLPRGNRHE